MTPMMKVTQTFEQIVDSPEEAHAFGRQSAELSFKYLDGFKEYDEDESG
jgi:hypothetical protein